MEPTTKSRYNPTHIPAALVHLELEVKEAYLSNDLDARCAVAGRSGSTVLIASAALPLQARQEAFSSWKKALFKEAIAAVPALVEAASELGIHEASDAGEVTLGDLDLKLGELLSKRLRDKNHYLRCIKEGLASAVKLNLHPSSPGRKPKWLVIRGDGEQGLFFNKGDAMAWGEKGNAGMWLYPLLLGSEKMYLPGGVQV